MAALKTPFLLRQGRKLLPVLGGILFWALLSPSSAQTPTLWISDLPARPEAVKTPDWLKHLPADPERTFAEEKFQILPPGSDSLLLVTVIFNEVPGGFLKVFWSNSAGNQTLSENFYEGIQMPNRRSLLIPSSLLQEPGTLILQSSQKDLQVSRIGWTWLSPKNIASAATPPITAIDANGRTWKETEINGNPTAPNSDLWKGNCITAPLLEKAERIEQGGEFEIELEQTPVLARLEVSLNGIPLDKNLLFWINGRPLSAALEIPDLTDPGYRIPEGQAPIYTGWRKADLWLPSTWIQKGVNKLQVSWGDESGAVYPVAVKDLYLQISFGAPVEVSNPAPEIFDHPIGPLPTP